MLRNMEKDYRFRIREERYGATMFDTLDGSVSSLTEDEYRKISATKKDSSGKEISAKVFLQRSRHDLPDGCMSAPSKVYLELTRRCNLFCKNCYNNSSAGRRDELSKEEIFKIIDELSDNGCFELRLTGGEPTLREDFFDIARHAIDSGLFVSLGTNGVWKEGLAEKIRKSGIRNIIFSIDGPEEINDRIRGKGSFRKAIESMSLLKGSGINVKINFTFGKDNIRYLEDVADIAVMNDVVALNVSPIRLTGRAAEKTDRIVSRADMLNLVRRIECIRKKCNLKIQTYFDILGKYSCECDSIGSATTGNTQRKEFPASIFNKRSCAAGIEVMVINPSGDIYGCAVSPGSIIDTPDKDESRKSQISLKKEFTAGNLREGNLMDIWLEPERWKIYRDLEKNKSGQCKSCRYYTRQCFGNCVISSYIHEGKPDAKDPYCFVDILDDDNE